MSVLSPKLHGIMTIALWVCICATLIPSVSVAFDNPCDPSFTTIDDTGNFFMSAANDPTGSTDTANLQCTFDVIGQSNTPVDTVTLDKDQFYLEHVEFECPSNKSCTFQGTSKSATLINFPDSSIDCSSLETGGVLSSGVTLSGNVGVQFMGVRADAPCTGGGTLGALLHFTGAPAESGSTCSNDVLFGALNRVDVQALSGANYVDTGVSIAPQNIFFLDACPAIMSGAFTATRVSVDGPLIGVFSSMQAGSRVGLDFLVVRDTVTAVDIFNSNQITEINFCDIAGAATSMEPAFGVSIARDEFGPNETNTNLYKCTFDMSSTVDEVAVGVSVIDFAGPTTMATSVANSTFNLQGANTFGVWGQDVNAGSIRANRFNGAGAAGLVLWGEFLNVTGWGVQANNGLGAFDGNPDAFFNESTSDNFFGTHAGATVEDWGCNLIQDFPGGGCAITGSSATQKVQYEKDSSPTIKAQNFNRLRVMEKKLASHRRLLRDQLNTRVGPNSNHGSD